MLDQYTVDRIVELLAANCWSNRQIARHLGVSRSTVDDIASGRRGSYGRTCEPPPTDERRAAEPCAAEPCAADPQPGRCPTCGVRVYLPCVACRARHYRRRLQHRSQAHTMGDHPHLVAGTSSAQVA